MIGLMIKLLLMGTTLFGITKAYTEIPLLNNNPATSGTAGAVTVLLLLWIFPKLIGLVVKFVIFSVVVILICRATGIDSSILKNKTSNTAQKKAEQITDTAGSVSDTFDIIQKTAESAKNMLSPTEVITARVKQVQTGHTMKFNNEDIQLYGIDTPDLNQLCRTRGGNTYSCGVQAQAALNSFVNNQNVKCKLKGKKNGKRLATCSVNGDDIAALMVRNGWAVADKAQTDLYVEEEKSAYLRKSGMWNGKFQAPWDWREKHPQGQEEQEPIEEPVSPKKDEDNSKSSILDKLMGLFGK